MLPDTDGQDRGGNGMDEVTTYELGDMGDILGQSVNNTKDMLAAIVFKRRQKPQRPPNKPRAR